MKFNACNIKPPDEALEQGRNLFSNFMINSIFVIVDLSFYIMPRKQQYIKFDDDSSGWYITFFWLHRYTGLSCFYRR